MGAGTWHRAALSAALATAGAAIALAAGRPGWLGAGLALAGAGLAFLGGLGVAAIRAGELGVDTDELSAGLAAIAAGDLGRRIAPSEVRGMEGVAGEFNRMAEQVRLRLGRLERRRQEADLLLRELISSREHSRSALEEKVRERTGELQKAYEELKKLDELKDSFLSSVSHELRTPLSSIRSFSELLLSYDGDSETRREFLGIIKLESERLTRLINDVLDISRIEAGEMPWRLEPVEVQETCEKAIAPLSILARERKQVLQVRIPSPLPRVIADPDRLIQVITNLVSNAVRFAGEGRRIEVTAEQLPVGPGAGPSGMVRIEVADDGIGIAREQLKNIFEKFKQVGDTLTGKPTGTGLGLPISREIVRHLGGTMWVESSPGSGSRFFVTLPVAEEGVAASPGAAPARRAAETPAQSPPTGERRLRALMVEDDAATRRILKAGLDQAGFEVSEAAGGEEAIEACSSLPPDLLTLDVLMAGIDGLATLRHLRREPRTAGIPVLLISDSVDREAALLVGANDHLAKPISPADVRDALRRVFRRELRYVAVADDDAGTVAVLSEMLRLRGYGVLTALDGEEALRVVHDHDVELLILDLNMPRKSGWKVLEELRHHERTKGLPVIVLTGMEAEVDRPRALALGAVELVEKGQGLSRLTAEIELLIQQRREAAAGGAAAGAAAL